MPDPTQETWLPVAGYEGIYEVSDHGRVRSLPRRSRYRGTRIPGGIRKLHLSTNHYLNVTLSRDGRKQTRTVHSLVTETFHGPWPDGQEVRHLNGDNLDCRASNLCWGSRIENMADKIVHGTMYQLNKTHCVRGHEFTPENTYQQAGGGRGCRECRRISSRARKAVLRRKAQT